MRPTPKRFIKAVFLISTLFLLLLNINLFLSNDEDVPTKNEEQDQGPRNVRATYNTIDLGMKEKQEPLVDDSIRAEDFERLKLMNRLNEGRSFRNISHLSNLTEGHAGSYLPRATNLSEIRRAVWDANRRQAIRNLDKFDVVASETTIVIVVQVYPWTCVCILFMYCFLVYLLSLCETCCKVQKVITIINMIYTIIKYTCCWKLFGCLHLSTVDTEASR